MLQGLKCYIVERSGGLNKWIEIKYLVTHYPQCILYIQSGKQFKVVVLRAYKCFDTRRILDG